MKGDFARITFDPLRHFNRVTQQQGRALLEADWNEQNAIVQHQLRALAVDLVGPCWASGPISFAITSQANNKPLPIAQWSLAPGHFYVDGILCENEQAVTLAEQPYSPVPEVGLGAGLEKLQGPFFLWIDVWERHISWIEAPPLPLNDPALNGVDTASRVQTVWQVRAMTEPMLRTLLTTLQQAVKTQRAVPGLPADQAQKLDTLIGGIDSILKTLLDKWFGSLGGATDTAQDDEILCEELRALLAAPRRVAAPKLKAQVKPGDANDDPCLIAADARFRGLENQLYRVEIHRGGLPATDATSATFKWSRENGSVIFPIVEFSEPGTPTDGAAQMTVELASLGRDARLGLYVGDWVELVDDDYTLSQSAAPLLEVSAIDVPNRTVTLSVPSGVTPRLPSKDVSQHALLRRWDQRDGVDASGTIAIREGAWIDLEDGVQVWFQPGALYATGDYWTIPARVSTADILWPEDSASTPENRKPAAVVASGEHHYAVLGGADQGNAYLECCCRYIPPCMQRLLDAAARPRREMMLLADDRSALIRAAATATPKKKTTKPT